MRYSSCTAVVVRMGESRFDQFLSPSTPPRCAGASLGSLRCDAALNNTTSLGSLRCDAMLTTGALERGGAHGDTNSEGGLLVAEPLVKTKRPPMVKVILLNDDYTPMDFVVMVLEQIFRIPHQAALDVMLQVHQKGAGLAGVYTRDVAETKVDQVIEYARINDYPLQCTLEQE